MDQLLMQHKFKKDKLEVLVFENRDSLGQTAAKMTSDKFKELLLSRSHINVIFAAAPSQNEFLAALVKDATIPWSKINAFHMDEYVGLAESAPQRFGTFLRVRLFGLVPFLSVNYIDGAALDIEGECRRYATLLERNPPDIVCMGIGENTHIAFNDPHKANFNDPEKVKMVELDEICRQQQVNDGCFSSLKEVPEYALTLTIPTLMQADFVYCMVPGKTKAVAVAHTLNQPVSKDHPSTILRGHPASILFVDRDSYSFI